MGPREFRPKTLTSTAAGGLGCILETLHPTHVDASWGLLGRFFHLVGPWWACAVAYIIRFRAFRVEGITYILALLARTFLI